MYNKTNFFICEDIMKIVILNGSLRKNGSTAYILRKFEKILLAKGAEIIYYDLIEQDIALCNGCCSCYRTGHCFINDDAEKISEQLKEADGVIIGTSTIASNVSGVLKLMIDRGHFVIEQLLHKKYAVCVSTYENYGGNDSLKVLKNLVTLSGSYLSGAFTFKLPFNSNYAENKRLNELSEKYAVKIFDDISKKRIYPLQRIRQNFVIKIGLKSFVSNKGEKYEAVQKRWEKLGLN